MPETWHDIDLPADPPDGELIATSVAGLQLVAVHHGSEWRVFADMCTHARCRFSEFGEIDEDDGILICNCHGAEFSLTTGDVLLEPAEQPLVLLPVRQADGRAQVDLQHATETTAD